MYTEQSIQTLLEKNDKAVVRGLLAIYARQTEDEQRAETTKVHNKIGFSAYDAPFMSKMVRFFKQRGYLTIGQIDCVRPTIIKYRRQLTEIANAKLSKSLHNEDLEMSNQAAAYEAVQERKAHVAKAKMQSVVNYGDFA